MSLLQNQFSNRYPNLKDIQQQAPLSPSGAPAVPSSHPTTNYKLYTGIAVFTLVLTVFFVILSLPITYAHVANLCDKVGLHNLFNNDGSNSYKLIGIHSLVFYLLAYLYILFVAKHH